MATNDSTDASLSLSLSTDSMSQLTAPVFKRQFPLSWSPTSLLKSHTAEHRLLARMPFFRSPIVKEERRRLNDTARTKATHVLKDGIVVETGKIVDEQTKTETTEKEMREQEASDSCQASARIGLVDIGNGRQINTLVIDSHAGKQPKHTLVMTHGYGAGLGFYYRCFPGLARLLGWRIYAVDWLGMANSSRPSFPTKHASTHPLNHVTSVEAFFVSSLEQWRIANNIDTMTLLGHSLGGYLSTCYALEHPDRVSKLILVSPVGVGKPPPGLLEGEFSPGRRLPNWITQAWNRNITPQWLIRLTGPFGPGLVNRYTSRRFAYLDTEDAKDFHDYLYHICAQAGSGEYALSALLNPGATARVPLFDRLALLKMPTTFMYGKEDWMDITHALDASRSMKVPVRVCTVSSAGHQIFMDNPDGFNEAVVNELTRGVGDKSSDSKDVQSTYTYLGLKQLVSLFATQQLTICDTTST